MKGVIDAGGTRLNSKDSTRIDPKMDGPTLTLQKCTPLTLDHIGRFLALCRCTTQLRQESLLAVHSNIHSLVRGQLHKLL